jgi:BA14K-like protein
MGSELRCKIVPRIVPRLAMLAIGAAFIATPALAQQPWQSSPDDQYMRSDSGPPPADNGGTYNEAPGGNYGGNYYDYAQGPDAAPAAGSVAYCQARFHSYDPSTGMYRGFDGAMHPCP